MRPYLIFRLCAPLAAMGDIAGHARRGGNRWPGKSAALGLVGAALGVDRQDQKAQQALQVGYGVSMLVRRTGTLLMDFHTSQTVPSAAVKRPISRKDAVEQARAAQKLNTTITHREYREDVIVDIAISDSGNASWPLEAILTALHTPRYILYFGRKSCPLAAPLAPLLIDADDPLAALRVYAASEAHPSDAYMLAGEQFAVCEVDALKNIPHGARIERRWDEATDRRTWHFRSRDAVVIPLSGVNTP